MFEKKFENTKHYLLLLIFKYSSIVWFVPIQNEYCFYLVVTGATDGIGKAIAKQVTIIFTTNGTFF